MIKEGGSLSFSYSKLEGGSWYLDLSRDVSTFHLKLSCLFKLCRVNSGNPPLTLTSVPFTSLSENSSGFTIPIWDIRTYIFLGRRVIFGLGRSWEADHLLILSEFLRHHLLKPMQLIQLFLSHLGSSGGSY